MTTFEASLLSDMQDGICKAGGVFYQYRPCRRNAETIYDIENIRHGVVYAQTPLNMNDPFDSMIGFSAEEFYEDCIDQLVNAINLTDPVQRAVITMLLRYKALGKWPKQYSFWIILLTTCLPEKNRCILHISLRKNSSIGIYRHCTQNAPRI